MPITNRVNSMVVEIKGSTIFVDGERVGALDVTYAGFVTKKNFLTTWDEDPFVLNLMRKIPDNYKFHYYWVEGIKVHPKFRGQGVGGAALRRWFATLKVPACVGLEVASISTVPQKSLERFYGGLKFNIFKAKEGRSITTFGLTFIKSK